MCVLDGSATLQDWMVWDKHPVRKQYDVIMDLGEGAFSQVVLGRHKATRKLAALKVVYLLSPDMDDEHLAIMKREAEFLTMLDSPRIVECLDVVDDGRQQVLVLEYLRGGQLYDSLHRLGGSEQPYTEQAASAIFTQMAEAVAFMHEYGIIHRDIKGENFVFTEDPAHAAKHARPPAVKLIDLGMSVIYDPKTPVVGALGSPGFVSPEAVHDAPHTPAMDVFSLGVVAFVMLVGRKPFSIQDSENLRYCEMDIKNAPGLLDQRWQDLSPAAKDLLMGMLRYNPKHRLTAQQVLEHDWVATRGGAVRKLLNADVAKGAANVAALRRLRNMAHGVVAVDRLSAALDPSGSRKRAADQFARSRQAQEKSKGYRNDPSGKGVSRMERMALRATTANASRVHDRGGTVEPAEDISVHYRPYREHASLHGGNAFYQGRRNGSSEGSLHKRSLKAAGSAVLLSELEADGSYHGGLGLASSRSAATLRRGSMGRASSLSSALAANLRGLADRSAHGGSQYTSSSDREDRSRSGRRPQRRHGSGALEGAHSGSLHGGSGRERSAFGSRGAAHPEQGTEPSKQAAHRVHRVSPLTEGRESLDLEPPPKRAPATALQQADATRRKSAAAEE